MTSAKLTVRTPTLLVFAANLLLWFACGGTSTTKSRSKPANAKAASPEAVLRKANTAADKGQFEIAEKHYRRAHKMRPTHFETNKHYIDFLIQRDKAKLAVKVASALVEELPGDIRTYELHATALIGRGSFQQAIATINEGLQLDDQRGSLYELRGRAHVLDKKFNAAVTDARAAVKLEPENIEFRVTLGSALHRAGKLGESALELRSALQLNAEHARTHLLLGLVLRDQFEFRDALSHHLKAARFAPNNPRVHYELAISHRRNGDPYGAQESLATAERLAPKVALYAYMHGELLRETKEWTKAVSAYERALALDPKFPRLYSKLGVALFYAGFPDRAEVILSKAIRLNRTDPYPYFNLGMVYERSGKMRLAIGAFTQFIKLAPAVDGDVPVAKRKVSELRRKLRRR